MPSDEEEILAANAAFYRAFASRDVEAMDALWSQRSGVACLHPGWRALHGRDEVMASWRGILGSPDAPAIACSEEEVYATGGSGFVVCVESVDDGRLAATNVFVREDDGWKMVHHHAGPIARTRDPGEVPPRLLN